MKAMKRRLIIIALCTLCLPRLQAQGVDEVLQSVAQHNKALQAKRQADAAEKTGIEAENGLEDPSVEYSSFFSKGVSGQAGSELVVSQGFDFPTVYGQRSRAGRERKEAVDLRAEALAADAALMAAEADTRAAQRTLSANRHGWLPKLEIGYRRNTGEDSKEHGFLVGGSIPLFSNRRQVKMARAQSVAAQLTADELRLQAEAALHAGFNEMQQLRKSMEVYDKPLMLQTLELLKASVKGGEMSVTDYFVEADQIYRNLQAFMELEYQYQKSAATLYKNRL